MTKILIIEDEAETRNVFLKCLEFEGFKTCAASNALDGIELAFNEQPNLIVCDILMPDMDGYFVLSKIRRSPKTTAIPFIFLTAKVTMAELRYGMQLGADDYLTKPCTVEQFLGAINVRLKRQQETIKNHHLDSKKNKAIASVGVEIDFPLTDVDHDFSFPYSSNLNRAFDFIEDNYHQPIKIQTIAEEVGYSPSYLSNLVQKETGSTVKQWIIARRMLQARKLLKNTNKPIHKIAELCGYHDAGYFTNQFRRFHGKTPLNWRSEQV